MPYKSKKQEGLSTKNIFSIIAIAVGLLSLLLLAANGVSYDHPIIEGYYAGLNMFKMIFGSEYAGINPGLLSALIIMVLGIISAALMNKSDIAGFASILFFITATVLWFCTIPLYGNFEASLGSAAIWLGILNFVCGVLVFIGLSYRQ